MANHYQTRNHSNAGPGALMFLDTEANIDINPDDPLEELQTLKLGVAHFMRLVDGEPTRQQTIRFRTPSEFWQFMRDTAHPKIPTWLIAHNLAYDLTLVDFGGQLDTRQFILSDDDRDVWGELPPDKGKSKYTGLFVDEDPPTIVQVKHVQGWRMVGMDSLNYYKCSLAALGKRLGYPKGDPDFRTAGDEELFEYCERDVEILSKSVLGLLDFVKGNDLGRFRLTAPAMAMGTLRHKFHNPKFCTHSDANVKKLERSGYIGGRLQMFRHGVHKGPFHALDVKSMYPFVMEKNRFPRSLWTDYVGPELDTLPDGELNHTTMAEVLIETSTDTFPVRHENTTIYPHGVYWTTLCGPELIRAASGGFIRHIGRWSKYIMDDLFSEFVEYFGTKRDEYAAEGDDLSSQLCKLMANSLYGKYGQQTPGWEAFSHEHLTQDGKPFINTDIPTGKTERYRRIGRHWQRTVDKGEHKQAFPAVAAWVTSHAREYLRSLMLIAGWENVLYVVTDSLIVTDEGLHNLVAAGVVGGTRRGELTYEHGSDDIELRSLHQYTMGSRSKFGSRKKSAENLGGGRVQEDQFQGLKGIIGDGWKPVVKVRKVIKHFSMKYNRGDLLSNGLVKPPVLNLPERPVGNWSSEDPVGLDTRGAKASQST
jgi:hypothetical protein